jgi:hypothetical protein
MSHGLAVAVATTLLSELGICDLQTFTNMVRHDTKGVLAALESDACRAAADAAAVEPAHTAHVSVQTETVKATVGTTMHSIVNDAQHCQCAPWPPFHQLPKPEWS